MQRLIQVLHLLDSWKDILSQFISFSHWKSDEEYILPLSSQELKKALVTFLLKMSI